MNASATLSAASIALALAGCASAPPSDPFGTAATVTFTVYASRADEERGRPAPGPVRTRLYAGERLVRELDGPQWTLSPLPAGIYRLDLERCDAAAGCRLVRSHRFRLEPGAGLLVTVVEPEAALVPSPVPDSGEREWARPARVEPRRPCSTVETALMLAAGIVAGSSGSSPQSPGAFEPPRAPRADAPCDPR